MVQKAVSTGVRRALGPGLLLAAVVGVYLSSLGNGFVYDDHEVIRRQAPPAGLRDLAQLFAEPHFFGLAYWRPLVRATLLLEKRAHGDDPLPFHLSNALLAGATALAAYALLRSPRLGVASGPALFAAALFMLHPVASSCVYPIASGRETLLPAALVLAAVAAHLRGGARGRALATALLAAALLGKEQAIVAPVLFAVADGLGLTPDPPGRSASGWLARYAGVAVVLAAYAAIRLALFDGGIDLALGRNPPGPLLSLAYGLQAVFAPPLGLVYEPELAVWLSAPRLLAAAAAALVVGAAARRTVPARVCAFWLGWFVLAQLPTANLLRQEAPFDERYVFLSSLAVPALLAAIVTRRWAEAAFRRCVLAVGLGLATLLAAVSVHRGRDFADDAAFAARWLATNPASVEAHHLAGLLAAEAGDLAGAELRYREALRLDPTFAEAHHNLGTLLALSGRRAEAGAELLETLRLAPDHPEALNNLGLLLAAEGRYAEAIARYQAALLRAPRFAEARNNLGTALARSGALTDSVAQFEAALRLAPGYPDAHHNLGLALRALGRREEARRHLEQALRLGHEPAREALRSLGTP